MANENNPSSASNFSAAVMGAMVGVFAGVAAVFLVDEKKRNEVIKKTQKVFKSIREKAADTSKNVEDKVDESKELLAEKLESTAKKFKT